MVSDKISLIYARETVNNIPNNSAGTITVNDARLIYKEFLHYIWQPTPVPAKFQDDSYGIKLNLISYN